MAGNSHFDGEESLEEYNEAQKLCKDARADQDAVRKVHLVLIAIIYSLWAARHTGGIPDEETVLTSLVHLHRIDNI